MLGWFSVKFCPWLWMSVGVDCCILNATGVLWVVWKSNIPARFLSTRTECGRMGGCGGCCQGLCVNDSACLTLIIRNENKSFLFFFSSQFSLLELFYPVCLDDYIFGVWCISPLLFLKIECQCIPPPPPPPPSLLKSLYYLMYSYFCASSFYW